MLSFMRHSEDLVAGEGRCLERLWPAPTSSPAPQHFSLLGDPNTTHLSKAGSAACISAQEQAKPACGRMLKGPAPKCLSGLSWVQASSAQHSFVVREAPERVSTQCSQRALEQDLEGIILGGK